MARWQPAERDARYRKARKAGRPVVVSEGDSWFDYPLYLNIIDRIDDQKRFALKRLEFSGDTVKNMVGYQAPWRGVESVREVVEAERPRFLLFSGGGNDIVGEELEGAIKPYDSANGAEWHLDTTEWRRLQDCVQKGYAKLAKTIGPLAPVIAHGYDFIVPSNKPVKYDGVKIGGPWVWPELTKMGIPDKLMRAIGKAMIEWFNTMLAELEQEHTNTGYFAHIDLRGTLGDDDWQNEIHPTRDGFKAIAAEFLSQLDAKLAPVIAAHDIERLGLDS